MNAYPLKQFFIATLFSSLILPLTTMAENLTDFTSRCETELELPQNSITGFDCTTGITLPTTQFGAACDSQALLGGPGCISNSTLGFKLFFDNRDVKGVWVCRKYTAFDNAADSRYHDIAMIIHNRKNGKTCFFQNNLDASSDGPIVPGPKDSDALSVWRTPQETASIGCTSCHSNDPFIVTPHVANALNYYHMVHFNPKGAYSVTGLDFANFNTQISRTEGCAGLCHFNPGDGGVLTTDALNKHWMVPGSIANYIPYNFNPVVGQFYTLRSNGQVSGFNGNDGGTCNGNSCPHWTLLDSTANTAKIAASGPASNTKLYQMRNTGLIFEFTGVQCSQTNSCTGWRMIDNNSATADIVSGAGGDYQMWNTGAIWKYTGTPCNGSSCPGWQLLDNNSATVQIAAGYTNLYQRHKGGAVWKYTGTPCGSNCPGWQLIANDSRTIELVADNSALYMFQKSGAIWQYTGTPCNASGCPGWKLVDFDNANTKQIVAGGSQLYRLYNNGEIWRYSGTAQTWVMLDNNPATVEITASLNGLLQRHNNGIVWRFTGDVCSNGSCPGWAQIQRTADTVSVIGARL